MIFLDTHVIAWLYQGELNKLPASVQRRLDREFLAASPFARLELAFLHEVGKTTESADHVIAELSQRLELAVSDAAAGAVCAAAQTLDWTRDPFDRLIAAHATVADTPLVTKDRTIRANLPLAWWGL